MHLKRQVFSYSERVSVFKPIHFFIHPLPLVTVVLTGLNDHYFKYQYPGLITGKLSDFMGLFYFPLFLSALMVLFIRVFHKDFIFNRTLLLSTIIFTDVIFCLIKLNTTARELFVNWFSDHVFKVSVTGDPTDLTALTSSVACYYFANQFFETKITAA